MVKRCAAVVLIFTFLFLGKAWCAGEESYTANPKFEVEKVVQDSKAFAAEKQKPLDKYFIDYVKYETSEKKWIVHFQGHVLVPGNDFMVFINEETGAKELMLGE